MADCALVIGISRYASLADDLAGSVSDALRMTEWLLRPDGGNVRPIDVRLSLSRRPGDTTPSPAHVPEAGATKTEIVDALSDLAARGGKRLFIYFAGHGHSAQINNLLVPVILASDFTWVHADNSFTLDSIRAFCATMDFPEQYFFIDACRDVKAPDRAPNYGVYPAAGSLVIPAPEQYGIHATSPGLTANQLQGYQRETGAFTSALIDALEGRRGAKSLDEALFYAEDRIRYRVTYHSVLASVVDVVERRKLEAAAGGGDLIQKPRSFGEHSRNPELVSFEVDAASRPRFMSTISVEIEPPTAAVESVEITGTVATTLRMAPWNTPPLLHGTYWVKATATGYVRAAPWPQVQLEGGPTTARVALQPIAAAAAAPPITTVLALPTVRGTEPTRGLSGSSGAAIAARGAHGASVLLAVRALDPFAALELVGVDGVRAHAFGEVTTSVRPGQFMIATVADDGRRQLTTLDVGEAHDAVERLVEVPALDEVTLHALASTLPFGGPVVLEAGELVDAAIAHAALPQGILACTLGAASLSIDGRVGATSSIGIASWRAVRTEPGTTTAQISTTRGDFELPVVVLANHVTSIIIAEALESYEVVMLWIPVTPPGLPEWRTAIIAQRALARGDLRWLANAIEASQGAGDPARSLLRLALATLTGSSDRVRELAAELSSTWPQFDDGAVAAALVAGAPTAPDRRVPALHALARRLDEGARSRLVPRMAWTAFAAARESSDSRLIVATLDQLAAHLAPAIAYLPPPIFAELPPLPGADPASIRTWLEELPAPALSGFLDRLPAGSEIVAQALRELAPRAPAPGLLDVAPSITKRDVPVVDRVEVWNELLALATSKKRILLITGDELTGKSHLKHLVRELCDRLTGHCMLYIDLEDQRSVERTLALGLAPQLDTAIELPGNAGDSTDMAWARAVAITVFNRIPTKIPDRTPWLVFDHFARMPPSGQATTFFNTLIEQVARQSPEAPHAMRLVLIGRREVPAEARTRTITREIRRVTTEEIATFVRSWRPGLAPLDLTATVARIVAGLSEASYMSDLGDKLAELLEGP